MWSMPLQSTFTDFTSANVCGSRKSSRCRASATTIAYFPSGVKYMLYGSSTGISAPGLPVRGSIGVRLLPELFVTYSVARSHAGTTCWGMRPTGKWSTTWYVAGSMTSTVLLSPLGT